MTAKRDRSAVVRAKYLRLAKSGRDELRGLRHAVLELAEEAVLIRYAVQGLRYELGRLANHAAGTPPEPPTEPEALPVVP